MACLAYRLPRVGGGEGVGLADPDSTLLGGVEIWDHLVCNGGQEALDMS